MSAAVYRHFAENGELLYVGFSINPFTRSVAHAACASWWMEVANISIHWYSTKEAAMAAESLAIKIECPRENVKEMPAGLFKKSRPYMRKPDVSPNGIPHVQLDAIEKEFDVSPRCWRYESAKLPVEVQNEIRASGRELLSSEVGALRRSLSTTFKRLEKIGVHRRNAG